MEAAESTETAAEKTSEDKPATTYNNNTKTTYSTYPSRTPNRET